MFQYGRALTSVRLFLIYLIILCKQNEIYKNVFFLFSLIQEFQPCNSELCLDHCVLWCPNYFTQHVRCIFCFLHVGSSRRMALSHSSCFAFSSRLNVHQRKDLNLTLPHECCQIMQLVFSFYHYWSKEYLNNLHKAELFHWGRNRKRHIAQDSSHLIIKDLS